MECAGGFMSSDTISPTILLVEDDAAVRKVVRRMLSDDGYTILEAGSEPEALELAANYPDPIQLLITDIIMPVWSKYSCGIRVEFKQAAQTFLATNCAPRRGSTGRRGWKQQQVMLALVIALVLKLDQILG